MAAQNESMRRLQSTLVAQLDALDKSLDDVTDPEKARAIVREMQEVNHRIGLAGGLLFAAQAARLDKKVAQIDAATQKVSDAIEKLENVKAFVKAFSDFLGLVDEAIDLAKVL